MVTLLECAASLGVAACCAQRCINTFKQIEVTILAAAWWLQIDGQLEFGRPHDRQIGRIGALENATDVDADQTMRIRKTAPVAHQPAGHDKLSKGKTSGNRMADRECGKLLAPINEEYIGANHERTCPQLGQACEGGVEVAFGARMQNMEL